MPKVIRRAAHPVAPELPHAATAEVNRLRARDQRQRCHLGDQQAKILELQEERDNFERQYIQIKYGEEGELARVVRVLAKALLYSGSSPDPLELAREAAGILKEHLSCPPTETEKLAGLTVVGDHKVIGGI